MIQSECPVCNAAAGNPCLHVGDVVLISFVDDRQSFHLARWLCFASFLYVTYNAGAPSLDRGPDLQSIFWEGIWP